MQKSTRTLWNSTAQFLFFWGVAILLSEVESRTRKMRTQKLQKLLTLLLFFSERPNSRCVNPQRLNLQWFGLQCFLVCRMHPLFQPTSLECNSMYFARIILQALETRSLGSIFVLLTTTCSNLTSLQLVKLIKT